MEENKEKLVIDPNKCIGCRACNSIASNNFGWGTDTAIIINEEVTEDAKNAIECCPTSAISIEKK